MSDSKNVAPLAGSLPRIAEPWLAGLRQPKAVDFKVIAAGLIDVAATVAALTFATFSIGALVPFAAQWVFGPTVVLAGLMLVLLFSALGVFVETGLGPCQTLKLRVQGIVIATGFAILFMI